MTWTNKVRAKVFSHDRQYLHREQDQEWLDAANTERKKDQGERISQELFEIIMDRLEKEWFDLVSSRLCL